jgi:putative transposase
MIIQKAYKFRIKTTPEIEQIFVRFVGHCRWIWNHILKLNKKRLQDGHRIMRYFEMDFWSKLWKQSEEYGFLAECPAHIIQQKLRDLDRAYTDAFDRAQADKRLPTIRKRNKHDSFRFPDPKQFVLEGNRIKLPKIGWVRFFKSQEIVGTPKNVTISRKGEHWELSVQVEQEIKPPKPTVTSEIGVDVGIVQFAACSNGEIIAPVHSFRKHEEKLAKAQRALSKKKKFSCNWKKQVAQLRILHEKIANVRLNFLHQCSTQLSKNHAMIVVEALKVKNMSKSAKGTIEAPGKKVNAKSGLNKSILDQGWGEFKRQLSYKMNWLGGIFLEVSPHNTSIRCASCGHIAKENRVNQANFRCVSCGHAENADVNAASNILAAGHAVLACGASA